MATSVPRPSARYLQWIRPALAVFVVAAVYFYRLDRPLLWEDETYTGILARNVLHHGYPAAYDGRNISLLDNGASLSRDLLPKGTPWAVYYVGALSLAIFGDDTAGLRVLFALAGVLAFFPIYAVLKKRIKSADLVTALALLAPQIVLFQRNARYYPILILLYAVLVWHLCSEFKSARVRFVIALAVMVLLFHTHPFSAACCSLSLALFCLCFRRRALPAYLCASAIGALSWLAWDRLLGPALGQEPRSYSVITSHFSWWLGAFLTGLRVAVLDVDVVDCFPALLWIAAIALLVVWNRRAIAGLLRDPLPAFILMSLAIQMVASAALFCYEGDGHYSLLRYMPHLLVFALILLFVALDAAIRAEWPYVLVCAAGVACNLATLSYWTKPRERTVEASWAAPVYSEIFHPPASPWDGVFARLRADTATSASRDQAIMALPAEAQGIMIFYAGDRTVVRAGWEFPPDACARAMERVMGAAVVGRIYAQPEWIVTAGLVDHAGDGYDVAALFPSHQARPLDGTRPELTRHSFAQPGPVDGLTLLRRGE